MIIKVGRNIDPKNRAGLGTGGRDNIDPVIKYGRKLCLQTHPPDGSAGKWGTKDDVWCWSSRWGNGK